MRALPKKVFNKTSLTAHKATHVKKDSKCNECEKVFDTKCKLVNHVNTALSTVKMFTNVLTVENHFWRPKASKRILKQSIWNQKFPAVFVTKNIL